jgi:tRNA dimethylallyltransferase
MSRETRIVVVSGPTGVGKTKLAIELARELDGELVGADSVQVYRGFDIGSSKPTAAELGGIAHHLIDVREPDEPLDAASYAGLADLAIARIARRGRLPIVVGGTGLWLRALLRGLVELPPVDAVLRGQLEAEWDREGAVAMHERLARVDPISARAVHVNDKLRVVRALEVHQQTGKPLGSLRAEHALGAPRYRDFTVVMDSDRTQLAAKVRARTSAMLEAGLVTEVRGIVERYGPEVRALQSVGYKQVLGHVLGGMGPPEMEREMNRATMIYARRQRTWWRNEPGVGLRVPGSFGVSERVAEFLRG